MKRVRINGIKGKLIICFTILTLISCLTLGYISIQTSSKVVISEAEKMLASLTVDASKLTESRIDTQMKTLEMISLSHNMDSMNWDIQQPILQKQVENTNLLDMAVVQPDGTAHYSDGSISQLGDREYVNKALNGEKNVSDLIVSRVTNNIVIMYAVPIERDGKVVGALIGRRDGDVLSIITEDTGFGESGYGYIINNKGTIVAHPDREKVLNQFNPIAGVKTNESLKSLATLFEKVIAERTGLSTYFFEGNELYAGYTPIKGTNWNFVITANKEEVLSAISTLENEILRILIFVLVISIIITFIVGHSITNPIIKAVQISRRISNLDITEDIPKKYLKKKDEIGDLAKAMQSISDSLRGIINDISNNSEQVVAASEELNAASQQSASAAEQISQTVEQIAKGAEDQAQNTEECVSKSYELGQIMEKDHNNMIHLNAGANKVNEVVTEGLAEIENLYKITVESNRTTNEIKDVIAKTNDSSSKIGQASNVISTIAQQTNLLALNAAIEAARAGNAGKGFAVVAEEIKNLAQQSALSTKEIDAVVNELQVNTHNAVKTIESVLSIADEQTKSVVNSKDKYKLIEEAMKETEEIVKQLNISGKEMEGMRSQILSSVENLSAIAEENSAATQEATASIEEQAASSEEIAGASEGLASLAERLQAIITKFKI
ncbi:methyl-accepting chemotaxis protein [Sedimentibacter acidaminivorans]|uniref:Methyl-accepting chemotaxis protein n=1 Tax=Sedimentibacter acidaminivorans TaxID=913099 RepID=A0ABS4G9C5_9FIRM|nr:methyl-accepting chemotaxis protein [Sedimentibacter acidaminivorans]MBP1924295.1 methyl-accepting chemotaxis protein [Sedimentibacter acidaminivorans]